MLAEIATGLSSLKAAKDIVQGLNAANTQARVNDVKIELQGLILDAQQGLFAAQEMQSAAAQRIANLEQEIVNLKDWEAEKQRYELADTGQGTPAYKLKEGMEASQPPHWICPHCYEQGKKSILAHDLIPEGSVDVLRCNPCGLEIVTHGRRAVPSRGSSGTWGRGR
ncbi:hypothetical protein [Altererythrobacter fulvus]|uniref:hypothetical protein n=1 Tax=Caenibius fulvus TaxID=2126012 RepID=UPI003017773C